ncbi:MAG: antitoxin, partial [Desulfobacterales bacterium]|nr:antitoxin [Desulfobacterales bacterium]
MKAITIRGIAPPVLETLKAEAKNKGKSVNQYVLDMLKQNLGLQKKK